MVCPNPLRWEQVAELIDVGTVQSLGILGRSEEQLQVYRKFMDKVKEEYASVGDFIKISVFEAAVHCKDGKKTAVDSEQAGGDSYIWRLNDFPYNFEPGMQHWLLWSARELPAPRIKQLIGQKFPAEIWETLHFTNPPVLQSVLAVWHCHVIVRARRKEGCAGDAAVQ